MKFEISRNSAGLAATFRVCATSAQAVKTAADRRLSSNDAVMLMLKWVERQMTRRKPRLPLISSTNNISEMDTLTFQAPSSA